MEIVSVIITTHNRSKQLINAIESVLKQTYKMLEIIVVDDCSKDNTYTVMQSYLEEFSNIQYIQLKVPSGANVARNQGIMVSKGSYITGLDDDDTMMTTRISTMMKYLKDDYAFVCTEVYYQITKDFRKRKNFKEYITLNDMLYYNHAGNQVLAKKESFIKAGLYDESIVAAQDYDMWLRLILDKPKAYCVQEALMTIDHLDTHLRITTSKNKIKGYIQVYNKYKHLYSKQQRKSKLLRLLKLREKDISIERIFQLATFHDYKSVIMIAIKSFNTKSSKHDI